MPYFETSAKDGTNIEEAFQEIAKNSIANEPDEILTTLPSSVRLRYAPESNKNNCSC